MFKSIPASNIAAIYPAVIGGGGNPLGLNTTLINAHAVYPSYQYYSADLVGQHYGLESEIHNFAIVYFNGFEGATTRANSLFISKFNEIDSAASLIGGDVSSLKEDQIKAITGTLSMTIDGVEKSGSIDLSTVSTLSAAAAAIAVVLGIQCTYESTTKSFVIASSTMGSTSSLSFASGSTADALKLTQATGAVLDNDTAKDTVTTVAERALSFSKNFVNFTYAPMTFDDAMVKDFASWVTTQQNRYGFVTWGIDPIALGQSGASFGEWAIANTEGVLPIYGTFDKAAFACGVAASVNYEEANGRTTTMFRSQSGLVADVTSESDAETLEKNGYSYYGAWATANDRFQFMGNGAVTGKFKWADNFYFQAFLNSQFQLACLNMFQSQNTIPYNEDGIAILRAYLQDPIDQGLNFGGIRAGVNLSNAQKFEVNQEAGFDAASQLFTKGWALSVTLPSTQSRISRDTFIIKFFYTDGSSMQRLEMTSTNVQ